jgi:hypothetical protein
MVIVDSEATVTVTPGIHECQMTRIKRRDCASHAISANGIANGRLTYRRLTVSRCEASKVQDSNRPLDDAVAAGDAPTKKTSLIAHVLIWNTCDLSLFPIFMVRTANVESRVLRESDLSRFYIQQ